MKLIFFLGVMAERGAIGGALDLGPGRGTGRETDFGVMLSGAAGIADGAWTFVAQVELDIRKFETGELKRANTEHLMRNECWQPGPQKLFCSSTPLNRTGHPAGSFD